jgi:ATP-dependent DNA helicase RecG
VVFDKVGELFNTFYKTYLPFELTNAQKRVIREIRSDTATGKQMNRLLQGDVWQWQNDCSITYYAVSN